MKNFGELNVSLNRACLVLLLAAIVLPIGACGGPAVKTSSTDAPQLMFVQIAEDLKVDLAANTLRLVKVNQQTLYFSDRPQRIAGHLKTADYFKEWTAQAGKDNFGQDPPNATLSVYEPGQSDNTVAVVEITNPVVDGADLIYSYRIISGTLPVAGGPTSLFIDWIAYGGVVGRGAYRGRVVY